MKNAILAPLFFLLILFSGKSSASMVEPEAVPYAYNGNTYTSVIATFCASIGYTNHLYCTGDVYAGTNDDTSFSYRCGKDLEYNHMLVHTYDPDGIKVYDQEMGSWWTFFSSGNTCSGFSESTLLTSEPIYYQPVYGEYPTDTVRFAANWSLPPDTPFGFPLQTTCSGDPCTAYTAEVSSVMDQSTLGTGATYESGEDGEVESFEGEIGDVGPYANSTCYAKFDSSAFGSSITYVGTTGTGNGYYLCYNSHPGYDYPAPLQEGERIDINAPESGTLCIATTATEPDDPPVLWRDTTRCPHATAGGTSWSGYHTFYIIHDGLQMNGVAGKYMTVFLHNDSLSSTVQSAIEQNGYAEVSKGDFIAKAGGWGPSGANHYSLHMHFEVYKWNGSSWDRVDPYGDGANNILWAH